MQLRNINNMEMVLNPPSLGPFDVHTVTASIELRWAIWLSSFKLYVTASDIKDNEQKRVL